MIELRLPAASSSELRTVTTERHSLVDRLRALQFVIQARHPGIRRLALALYDSASDRVTSFASSAVAGEDDLHLGWRLQEAPALLCLSQTRSTRVVNQLRACDQADPATRWLVEHGYRSSYTVPVYAADALVAFLFFDSVVEGEFTAEVTDYLDIFADLVTQLYLLRMSVVRTLLGAVGVAKGLARIRDVETGAHLERMAHYSSLIAREVASHFALSDEAVEYIGHFAPLHDIGKVGIPDDILLKPGRLSPAERAIMQGHVDIGERLVDQIVSDLGLEGDLSARVMRNIVGQHHERGDGSGYPRGLSMSEIAAEARIVAVADVYDALVTTRPYKAAWMVADSEAELRRMAVAGQLDATCVDALVRQREARLQIARSHADGVDPGSQELAGVPP